MRNVFLAIALLVGDAIGLTIIAYEIHHFKIVPDSTMLYVLAGVFTGVLGFLLSGYGAWLAGRARLQAAAAANKSSETIRRLTEAQILAEYVESDYQKVFDKHFATPVREAIQRKENIIELRMLLSTPSYGNPPLSNAAVDPAEALNTLTFAAGGTVQLVFFSPDAHYLHWGNILLSQGDIPNVESYGLLEFLRRVKRNVLAIESHMDARSHKLRVWATHSSPIRMTCFHTTAGSGNHREKHSAFLVFADNVSLGRPMSKFAGRCFDVPRSWHKSLLTGDSPFLDEFKKCPYSLGTGLEAELKQAEVRDYLWDLIFGRTSRVLFTAADLHSEIVRLLATANAGQKHVSDLNSFAAQVFVRGCEALNSVLTCPDLPDQQRDVLLTYVVQLTGSKPADGNWDYATLAKRLAAELQQKTTLLSQCGNPAQKHVVNLACEHLASMPAQPWVPALYLLMASNFGTSRLAKARAI